MQSRPLLNTLSTKSGEPHLLLDQLNEERIAVPWLNGLVLQFFIDEERDLHPLTKPEKRKWFLNRGKPNGVNLFQ
jgi:hypothetical protein